MANVVANDPARAEADRPVTQAQWIDDGWTPDAVVISLGTNDWNLQKTDPFTEDEFVGKYLGLVHNVRAHYPHAWIVRTQCSIVGDPVLSQWVQETVKRMNDPGVVWFASHHFPGSTCDTHPDKMQHLDIADDFEVELRKLLGWCCVKKRRKLRAVRKLKKGPSEPPCRGASNRPKLLRSQRPRW